MNQRLTIAGTVTGPETAEAYEAPTNSKPQRREQMPMTESHRPRDTSQSPAASRQHRMGDTGTLQYLRSLCTDAANGSTRIAELLDKDNDPSTAEMFRDLASERKDFARRISELLSEHENGSGIRARGTFRGRLFRGRLQVAERIPIGYSAEDDRRSLLRLARRGSDLMKKAYSDAAARPLSVCAREEVEHQARVIGAANHRIHQLVARAEGR